ncbi:MAG: hypothetical protein IT285_02325 [Bdellovibrionales bacterium]|nr:hypothetical protein [Bdellovibrionales bacterium]
MSEYREKFDGPHGEERGGLLLAPFSSVVTVGGITLALFLSSAGCAPPEYRSVDSVEAQQAAGQFTVPAKVDILLAEDDSGSMYGMFDQIESQLPQFLAGLESSGWDYRFATVPLTTPRALTQIMASRYDGNWAPEGQWREPFPGAAGAFNDLWLTGAFVSTSYFRFPPGYTGSDSDDYTHFLTTADLSTSNGSLEPAFQTMHGALDGNSTGFLRPDAMLVLFTISNGNDSSGLNFCKRQDGQTVPCENAASASCPAGYGYDYQTHSCRQMTNTISLDQFAQDFRDLKGGNAAQVKYYSAVSTIKRSNCLGANAKDGYRYESMAARLNGWTRDLCTNSLSSILGDLESTLVSQRLDMRTRYLVIEQEPNLSTVKIYRKVGGSSSNRELIPQNASNGWSYIGHQTQLATIDYPAPLNRRTGYFFRLNGSSALIGADSADVEYLPVGITP